MWSTEDYVFLEGKIPRTPNCIIHYNSALLSAFLQIQERNGRQDVVDVISRLSPVAWQHINLNGEYAFNKDRKEIDLAGLLSDVESIS